jgi:predicted PurR-regulated permease PerM
LHVILLYIVLQSLDGYVFTPLVDKKTVSLPPALILFSQLLFSLLMGFLGLLLATPLATTAAILIEAQYIEEKIEKKES